MIAYTKPSYRRIGSDPEMRLLAAVLVRTYRDLSSRSTRLKQAAIEFFDDEGVAWLCPLAIVNEKYGGN